MLKTRLIARLDIKGANLIKPVNLEGLRVVGDPQKYATKYNDEGIDELIFMDAVASLYGRNNLESLVSAVTQEVFVPVTVGGGIRAVGDVRRMLQSGADKTAINTAAIKRPELIAEVAEEFGAQCMVLQIDAKRNGNGWEAYTDGGREHTGRDAVEWAKEAAERGAGEIFLTSIDREGTRRGFDLELTQAVSDAVSIPVVASGGAGNSGHLIEAINIGASAVAVADILHYERSTIYGLKNDLINAGIAMRM